MRSAAQPTMAEFFGWQHHPFADVKSNAKAFVAPKDERIRDRVLSLLRCGKSLALCGPSGVGKTSLAAHIVESLDVNCYKPVLLHYAGYNRAGLLRAVADRLGVDTNGRSVPLLVRLQKHLLGLTKSSNSLYPVVFVDDAQLLEKESMMDLCSLTACADKKTVAASVVLIGDDNLPQRLSLASMAPVESRLTAVFPLDPLDEEQSKLFIKHRVEQAKAPKELIEEDALDMITAHCRGNRRRIVNTVTLLLDEAFFRQENTVSTQTMLECDLIQPADRN